MRLRLVRTVVALAALGALVSSQTATAGGGTKTTVTINASGDPHGKVKSTKESCVEGRKVKVYRVKPGADDKIGNDSAGSDGAWSIGNPGGGGKIYAKVSKIEGCDGDKSPTVDL